MSCCASRIRDRIDLSKPDRQSLLPARVSFNAGLIGQAVRRWKHRRQIECRQTDSKSRLSSKPGEQLFKLRQSNSDRLNNVGHSIRSPSTGGTEAKPLIQVGPFEDRDCQFRRLIEASLKGAGNVPKEPDPDVD